MLLIAGLLGMAAVGSVVMIGAIGDDDDGPGDSGHAQKARNQ